MAAIIESCKPNANIKEIKLLSKGDIKVVGETPHDFCILQQPWPNTDYGPLTAVLPNANTVDQAVLIFGVHLSIETDEIEGYLNSQGLFPKEVVRFKKPQSAEASNTVKVVFGSAEVKERFMKEGFRIYCKIHKVISYDRDPPILQCFRCQGYGHSFYECTAQSEKCLRCSGTHRMQACTCAHADAKCANCSGNHTANYRGCPTYKAAVLEARKKNKELAYNNNNNGNSNNNSHSGGVGGGDGGSGDGGGGVGGGGGGVGAGGGGEVGGGGYGGVNIQVTPDNSKFNNNNNNNKNNNSQSSLSPEDLIIVLTSCMQKFFSLMKEAFASGIVPDDNVCQTICAESIANVCSGKKDIGTKNTWSQVVSATRSQNQPSSTNRKANNLR